jgi:hypothetical protein
LLSRQTIDLEARHYLRLGGSGLLATRIRGFKSMGDYPDFLYFGGNGDLRGYDYLQFAGQNTVYANAESRFPLIEAALTPIGVIGGIRGSLPARRRLDNQHRATVATAHQLPPAPTTPKFAALSPVTKSIRELA